MSEEITGSKSESKPNPVPKKSAGKTGKFAAVLIRSAIQADGSVSATLSILKLRKKNACAILDITDSNKGMLFKAKDYIAYGEIAEETVKLLDEKRGAKGSKDGKIKIYALHPPVGGFEKKGIKKPFYLGGALGYRGDKMGDLIKKMI